MSYKKKQVNLLPLTDFEKSGLGKIFSWCLQVGRYLIIVTELVVIAAFISRFKLDRDLADLNASIEDNQTIIASFGELESNVRFLQERLTLTTQLEKGQLQPTQVLDALAKTMPPDIYLTSFNLKKSSFTLDAVAISDASIATFLAGLTTNKMFKEVNLTSLKTGGTQSPTIKFSLTVKM